MPLDAPVQPDPVKAPRFHLSSGLAAATSSAGRLGYLELEVLDIIWASQPASARDVFEEIRDRGRILAQSTVATVLRRLSERGFLDQVTVKRGYIYSANISREELGLTLVDQVVDYVYRGNPVPAIEHLLSREGSTATS